jgi:hypothetical protein
VGELLRAAERRTAKGEGSSHTGGRRSLGAVLNDASFVDHGCEGTQPSRSLLGSNCQPPASPQGPEASAL